jgi:sensor histidine kinase YesM
MNFFYRINNKITIFILILICIISFVSIKTYTAVDEPKNNIVRDNNKILIEYMEDTTGDLTFKEISSENLKNNFIVHKGSTISNGYSKSTWWFRIKLKDSYKPDLKKIFSINNPVIEKTILYLPQNVKGHEDYYIMKAGWGFKNNTDDIGFIYPVFQIPQNTNLRGYMYIQSKSLYTQNYEFKIMQHEEFEDLRQLSLFFIGILFGVLIAMLLYNLMISMFLRDVTYVYYSMFIFTMIIYQSGFTGVINIFKWKLAYLIEQYLVMIGVFMYLALVFFIRSFLKTNKNIPKHDKFLKISIGFMIGIITTILLGYEHFATVISPILIIIFTILFLSATIACLHRGVREARYVIIAWSVMIIAGIVFVLRGFGFINQNLFIMNFSLASAAIESILLSVALADRIKILREEKDSAFILFEGAERSSKLHEISFLQAQIKPHFLYNALNVIATLCRIEPLKARELILDLSSYLHHTFDINNTSEYITFEEELEFIEAYVRIEKARFREKLKVEYEVEETSELMLPKLILQPLVENAIRHGIRKKEQGGTVIIRAKNEKECFVIEVDDNGVGMDQQQLEKIQNTNFQRGKGIGVVNIRLRLKEIYGTDLKIKSEVGKGTLVSFKIHRNLSLSQISNLDKIKKHNN